MKIDWRDKTNWFGAVLLLGAAFLTIYKVGKFFDLDENAWAAWVQAVGSVAAIVAAIRISKNQSEQNRLLAKEQAENANAAAVEAGNKEVRNSLRAMSAEIHAYRNTIVSNADKIASSKQPGVAIFPEAEIDFPVYQACAKFLGQVDDDALRHNIIRAYSSIRVFFEAMNRNSIVNRLLRSDAKNYEELKVEVSAFAHAYRELVDSVVAFDDGIRKKLGVIAEQE